MAEIDNLLEEQRKLLNAGAALSFKIPDKKSRRL